MKNLTWILLNIRFYLMEYLMNSGSWSNTLYEYVTPKRKDTINVFNLWRLRRYLLTNVTDDKFSMTAYVYPNPHGIARCLITYTYRLFTGRDYKVWRPTDDLPLMISSIYGFQELRHKDLMTFIFSYNWVGLDDTRLGACERIKFVILHDNYNYDQLWQGKYLDIFALWYRLYTKSN